MADPRLMGVLNELSGRNDVLCECWQKVLVSVGVLDLEDLDDAVLQTLRAATHEVLAERLGCWLKVQRAIEPYVDAMERKKEQVQREAQEALDKLLKWSRDDDYGWQRLSDPSTSTDAIEMFSNISGSKKACAFVRCDAKTVAAILWAQVNADPSDVAYFVWDGYEVRRHEITVPVPFCDDREIVYIRFGCLVGDKWAIMNASIDVQDIDILSVKPRHIRATAFDGYVIESLPYGLSRVVRVLDFKFGGMAERTAASHVSMTVKLQEMHLTSSWNWFAVGVST